MDLTFDAPHYCVSCRAVSDTFISETGEHRCLTCLKVIWIPIAWTPEGDPCGWMTRVHFARWSDLPQSAKVTCLLCGFTWQVGEHAVCPVCKAQQ